MAIEIDDLKSLDNAKVLELLSQLTEQLQELNPSLDLRRGVFHDTVAYFQAILEAAIRTNLDRYLSARSLLQISQQPELADDEVVDHVLSNWGVTRRAGTPSEGLITVELSSPRIVSIPAGSLFQANGFSYQTQQTYVSRISAESVVGDGDRLIRALSNGNFAFTVPVQSTETGPNTRLKSGELVTPVLTIPGYVTSYATSSFSVSTDTQTNRELVASLQTGIAVRTMSNRVTMQSLIRNNPQFETVVRQSIIGYGDSEMTRDQHSIFPISSGGRVDWYIRTSPRLSYRTLPVTATLLSKTTVDSQWQFSIPRDSFPGFYEIERVYGTSDSALNSGFEVLSQARGYDLTGPGFVPDIVNLAESAYSAYQTAIVVFRDDQTPTSSLTVGQTREYLCDLSGLPLISEIQQFVNDRDTRSYAADALVKSPVPCFVSISFSVNQTAGSPEPPLDSARAAVVDFINSVPFTGRLDASLLIDVLHNVLGTGISITNFHMVGRIRKPNGSMLYLQSKETLLVPHLPKEFVTGRTVQFFAEESDIGASVNSSSLTE